MGHVEQDLRRYQREQDEAEREYMAELPIRRFEALDKIKDESELRKILEDEVLAGPLSRIMHNLEDAGRERSDLMGKIPDNELIGITAILQSASQLEKLLFHMVMGEE